MAKNTFSQWLKFYSSYSTITLKSMFESRNIIKNKTMKRALETEYKSRLFNNLPFTRNERK